MILYKIPSKKRFAYLRKARLFKQQKLNAKDSVANILFEEKVKSLWSLKNEIFETQKLRLRGK